MESSELDSNFPVLNAIGDKGERDRVPAQPCHVKGCGIVSRVIQAMTIGKTGIVKPQGKGLLIHLFDEFLFAAADMLGSSDRCIVGRSHQKP
jgi:hypothetical protein